MGGLGTWPDDSLGKVPNGQGKRWGILRLALCLLLELIQWCMKNWSNLLTQILSILTL